MIQARFLELQKLVRERQALIATITEDAMHEFNLGPSEAYLYACTLLDEGRLA